jgi:hypothetical protein
MVFTLRLADGRLGGTVVEQIVSVIREQVLVVDADCAAVANAVRAALARGQASYDFKMPNESEDHLDFCAVITPHTWLMLTTRLLIELHPEASKTKIVARTISQAFIMGDIFDYYRKYLRDVLTTIQVLLGNPNCNLGQNEETGRAASPFAIANLVFRHFGLRIASLMVAIGLILQYLVFPSSDLRPLLLLFGVVFAARAIHSIVQCVNWWHH